MLLEEREVAVEQLELGMWVCRLDRPWEGTPFLLQGLLIETPADIALLARYSKTVYVDVELSKPDVSAKLKTLPRPAAHTEALTLEGDASVARGPAPAPRPMRPAKTGQMPTADDMQVARESVAAVVERTTQLFESLREGNKATREAIEAAVEPVVQSVTQNQDAFMWLMALKRHSNYEYAHAINCCAFAAAFAHEIALPNDRVNAVAVGALIMNIGMVDVPEELVNRAGPLTEDEMRLVRQHVDGGLDRARNMDFNDTDTLAMIAFHHEHFDGNGYPRGVKGTNIPMAGRLAAIVDAFDALSNDRPYREAVSRSEALHELYKARASQFHSELVEEFVKCLGIYPVGSLVELNNGEVAIVMVQNALLRLRPRIMVLTDPDKKVLGHFHSIDLSETRDDASVHILRTLNPGAFGLDPSELFL